MDEAEQLRELLDEVREKDFIVIVEGPNDKRALKHFGITNVIYLNMPLFSVVEVVASRAKEAVILTDLDSEGKDLYHRLFVDLQRHGVKVNNKLRDFLFKTKLRQIEGLVSYISSIEG